MAEWPLPQLPGAAAGMGQVLVRRIPKCQNPALEQWVCPRFLGHWAPHPYFACVEGKSFSWQGNGDKWGATSFIWGLVSAELAVITNFLSQLTQHFCQRSPGHAVCSRADLLFCADSSSCFRLWLKSYGIYSWASPDSPLKRDCGNVSCASSSLDACPSAGRPVFVSGDEIPLPLWRNPI